jgi:hypothetical protein
MALRQDLRTYQEKMNRRFWVIVVPLVAAPLLLLPAIQRSVPRGAVPKWVLVVIPAVLLGFVVLYRDMGIRDEAPPSWPSVSRMFSSTHWIRGASGDRHWPVSSLSD